MGFLKKARFLNSNTLKLLAAFFMLLDHFAIIFFPHKMWIRWLGRISMPLFAFTISEGCRYTRSKVKHFCLLFGLGVVCQIGYYIFDPGNLYFSILITFSFSVALIYALQYAKKCLFNEECKLWLKIGSWVLFGLLLTGTYFFCEKFVVDYGFFGIMMPVFASIFDFHRIPAPNEIKKFDCLPARIFCMAIPLFFLMITHSMPSFVAFSFLAFPILLLYNGEKGKLRLKYFFYVFYPLHLVVLEGIYIFLYYLI